MSCDEMKVAIGGSIERTPRSLKGSSNKEVISSPKIGRPKMVATSCNVMVMKLKGNTKVFVVV